MREKPIFRLAYLIGSTGWGGLEMNQLHNAQWMRDRGHFVLILCVKNSPAATYLEKKGIPYQGISKHKNHFDLWRAISLLRILKTYSIQHLIIRSVFDMSIAASVRFFSGKQIHVHYFMEMQLTHSKKQWFRTMRYRFFSSWNCPLDYMKEQVIKNTNMPIERVHLIPSAIQAVFFERPDKNLLRKKLGLPEHEFTIGLFGRIDRKKNQLVALKALLLLEDPTIRLLLIGQETPNDPQAYLSELRTYSESQNLDAQLTFLGHVEDVSDYMHAVDICLVTSENESVGMVTLEAKAAGKIVVGTKSGGTEALLQKTPELLFEPTNAVQLSSIIKNVKNTYWKNPNELSEDLSMNRIEAVCAKVEELLLSCS